MEKFAGRWHALVVMGLFSVCGCRLSEPAKPPLFQLMENTGVNFENDVQDGKLDNSFLFRNFYNGGGVAIGDVNNDGLPDIFLTSNMGSNKLYINKGNFKFEDVTDKAGFKQDSEWCTGVVMVDINNDGWLDIYVCSSGHMSDGNRRNKLYINNHDGTFTESAHQYGLDIKGYTTQVSFFDYDGDGDLDCFMINNSPIPVNTLNNANRRDLPDSAWPVRPMLKGGGDHLYRNDGGYFHEVTQQAGIHGSLISFGLGVSVGDINGDGLPDIYVSNDSYERDYLYINQGNGTFKDMLDQCLQHISMSSMGADLADINNDGYPDIITTDMLPDDDYRLKTTASFDNIDLYRAKVKAGFYYQYVKNCLQLNNGNGKFLDIGNYAGVSASDWSWGALMFDADNDGYNDIYICNGVNRDVTDLDFLDFFANDVIQKMVLTGKKDEIDELLKKIPQHPLVNKVYRNLGNLKFQPENNEWGITQPSFSNGAAYGDLDGDGDLDLVVNNENQPAFIYKNNARELNHNHYLGVLLRGKDKNTFAIGSKIKVYAKDQVFYREVVPSRGFQSSMDYKQIIGLGAISRPDSMVITWPDRTMVTFLHPPVDTNLVISQGHDVAAPVAKATQPSHGPYLLDSLPSPFLKNEDDDYVDFYYERNLPELLSREGPKVARGDVNGDGLEDIYIGGTVGHPGRLYLQTSPGHFELKKIPLFDQFIEFEDEAVLFFDADGDGDLDLFVGPGGNDAPPYSRLMQNRLYLNDGKGNFTLSDKAFSGTNGMNTGVAVAYDFNHDGYLDLFVGGRSVPRQYGVTPGSYVYINDGKGHFTDMAATKNPDIAHVGMVTGAVMANVDTGREKDLVIVGEWMAPRIFSFRGDHFVEVHTNLEHMTGMWQCVAAADLNGDGRADLILGNIGENFYLCPDSANPVKIWMNDFDGNGTQDQVLTSTVGGKDLPVYLKHDMEDQFPTLKKQNLRHSEYAKKSIQELFSADVIGKCVMKEFTYPSSCIAISEGNGQFKVERLPTMVQLSCVNAIFPTDIDRDGHVDLVMGGNNSGFLPQFGRLDASFGHVLLGDGKGNMRWMDPRQSGLQVEGVIRDITGFGQGGKENYFLFLRNDDYPAYYRANY